MAIQQVDDSPDIPATPPRDRNAELIVAHAPNPKVTVGRVTLS